MEFMFMEHLALFGQLLLAVILGASIGLERTLAKKSAGMRTFAFVALGSTMFTIASVHAMDFIPLAGFITFDPTRIAAQIVTGVGFIGAGVIIFTESKLQGATTASGFWLAAAIGMAIGFEMYSLAVFATILALFVFHFLWLLEEKIRARQPFYRGVAENE